MQSNKIKTQENIYDLIMKKCQFLTENMKKSQINFYYSGPHSKSSGLNMSKKEDFILGGDDINTDVYLDCWY